ncbi:MAG: HAD-IA family hydrolase, partial [Pseudomonadota bacterium]
IEGPMGFGPRVEQTFASGHVGFAKPDPAFFRHIESALGAEPGDLMLIDDTAQNVAAARARGWRGFHFTDATRAALPEVLENVFFDRPTMRLATYGTLAPGQVNHHVMDGMQGMWTAGHVKGTLLAEGWGADHGCPGIVLDPDGAEIAVQMFTSADLKDHWARLDAFEGAEYRRVETVAMTAEGPVPVAIYELAPGLGRA